MEEDCGPERRTIPIPPRPAGVETAAMVSSRRKPSVEDADRAGHHVRGRRSAVHGRGHDHDRSIPADAQTARDGRPAEVLRAKTPFPPDTPQPHGTVPLL